MSTFFLFCFYWFISAGLIACLLTIRTMLVRIERLERKADIAESSVRGLKMATGILSKRLDAQESVSG